MIMYTAKFDAFLFDQISSIKFWKYRACFISSNYFDEKEPINIKISTCEEKITKTKLQINEISIHVHSNSRIQIVQHEFITWKYKVKISADAASGGVL